MPLLADVLSLLFYELQFANNKEFYNLQKIVIRVYSSKLKKLSYKSRPVLSKILNFEQLIK